jgi:Domain of unknown function (DUF4282)
MAGRGERTADKLPGDELAGQPPNEPPWQAYGQGQEEPGWSPYGQPAENGNARVYAEPGPPYGGPGGPGGPGAPGGPYGDPDATRVQRAVDYPAPDGAQGSYEQADYTLPGGQGQYDPSGGAQGQYDQPANAARARDMHHVRGAKGFVASLFDFDFTSFVTPKIIKILYILIVVVTGLGGITWTLIDFRISVAFGLITLVVIAPLIFFVTIALYRVILEFFAVVFRLAEDIHVIRERGDRLG